MHVTASLPVQPIPPTLAPPLRPTRLLHGAFAIPDQRRGYTVVDVQQGVITALDEASTTVTSPDGFTRTYLVGERDREIAGRAHGVAVTTGCRVLVASQDGVHQLLDITDPASDVSDHGFEADDLPAAAR